MKLPLYGLGWALAASIVLAADPAAPAPRPEWKGIIDLDPGRSFLVVAPGETAGNWEKVGDTFGDWTVTAYRAADHILVVQRRDGTKLELVMNESPAAAAAAAPPAVPAPNDIALNYLQERTAQLLREALSAEKAFKVFKERHGGVDPSLMAPGPVAEEGLKLQRQFTVALANYDLVRSRLAERQRQGAGVPSSAPTPPPSN